MIKLLTQLMFYSNSLRVIKFKGNIKLKSHVSSAVSNINTSLTWVMLILKYLCCKVMYVTQVLTHKHNIQATASVVKCSCSLPQSITLQSKLVDNSFGHPPCYFIPMVFVLDIYFESFLFIIYVTFLFIVFTQLPNYHILPTTF